jgi:F0F1-type ATP synthase assembly protein I
MPSKKRIMTAAVSRDQMLFWLGLFVDYAAQERHSDFGKDAYSALVTAEQRRRERLKNQLLEAEIERTRAEAERARAEAEKARVARTEAEQARDEKRREKSRKFKIEVGQIASSILTVSLGFFTAITAPTPKPFDLSDPPSITQPDHQPNWLTRLLNFLRPLIIRVESSLIEAENAVYAGVAPALVRDNLVAYLESLKQESLASPAADFKASLERQQEIQRINTMTDIFLTNVSTGAVEV